jgi:hypothetical protein
MLFPSIKLFCFATKEQKWKRGGHTKLAPESSKFRTGVLVLAPKISPARAKFRPVLGPLCAACLGTAVTRPVSSFMFVKHMKQLFAKRDYAKFGAL